MHRADDKQPGRAKRTKGGYTQGMFNGIRSVEEFAAALGVPIEAINYVLPTNKKCKSPNCPFNAIEANDGRCPAHERSWYPLLGKKGGDLLGVEFSNFVSGDYKNCQCCQEDCKSAGYYPKQDALYISRSGYDEVFSHTNLISTEKKKQLLTKKSAELYLYPWHFFPEHCRVEDGEIKLDWDKKGARDYFDQDGSRRKSKNNFPPPRNTVGNFLRDEYFAHYVHPSDRWAQENSVTEMPTWMLNILALDVDEDIDGSAASPSKQSNKKKKKSNAELRREVEMWKGRAHFLQWERSQMEEHHEIQLSGSKRNHDNEVKEKKSLIKRLQDDVAHLVNEKKDLTKQLSEATTSLLERMQERKRQPLRYSDLYPGGILSKHVHAFTLFDTVEQNDAFLEWLNFTDGTAGSFPQGDGLCENVRSYSKVPFKERSGETEPPTYNEEEYAKYLRRSKAARKNRLSWKDDYLAWCLYVRAGMTQAAAGSLVGIETTRMSDIFHEWANVLDDGLQELFPRPTRSQMLQNYPIRFIEADGHARCWLLLDAFEIFTQAASNPNVASATHSDYKGHTTIKTLGATDPIGCSWGATVPDGNPGRASDVFMTQDSKILRQVPFGHTSKVDKGFICDNEAAKEGVIIDRPQKRLRNAKQQSSVDTSQTQKIGNTRIIVENVNGELKLQIRYLNVLIPTLQFGIVSKIVRIGYLLQNFKKAIVQRRGANDIELTGERPCRGEVRWCGAADEGLRDIRGDVRLWGLDVEIKLFEQLSAMPEWRGKSRIEVGEEVLSQNLDLEMRKQMYHEIHSVEYDGTT